MSETLPARRISPAAPAPTPGASGGTIYDLLRLSMAAAWRRRYVIVIPIILMIPVSLIVSRTIPKTYEAKTLLLLQETSKENPFLKDFAIGLNVKERISALKTLLQSEHILLGALRETGVLREDDPISKVSAEVRRVSSSISVQLAGSDILELRLRGRAREGLGSLLDAITRRFLSYLLSPERSRMAATQLFLREQMDKRQAEHDALENAAADFKRANATLLPDMHEKNLVRLQNLEVEHQERRIELAAARASLAVMRAQLAASNPIVGRLEESIIEVSSRLASLRSRYTDAHSEVKAAENELARLEADRRALLSAGDDIGGEDVDLDRLWRIAAGTASAQEDGGKPPLLVSQLLRLQDQMSRIATLEEQLRNEERMIAELRKTIQDFAPVERERQRIENAAAKVRALVQELQQRYENATTSLALGEFEAPERVKVIDPAIDPSGPINLPGLFYLIAGIIAGLAMGGGLAVMFEILDQRVRQPEQIARLAGAAVLARLPKAAPEELELRA